LVQRAIAVICASLKLAASCITATGLPRNGCCEKTSTCVNRRDKSRLLLVFFQLRILPPLTLSPAALRGLGVARPPRETLRFRLSSRRCGFDRKHVMVPSRRAGRQPQDCRAHATAEAELRLQRKSVAASLGLALS
jgi:hypothetical protein